MNALPILLLGGAALMMMGGSKSGRGKGTVIEQGQFESGEEWQIRYVKVAPGAVADAFGKARDGVYAIDVKLDERRWTTVRSNFYNAPMGYPSIDEAKDVIDRLARTEILIDERGVISIG